MFLGPTGVGKTELGRALAEFMFNDDKALIRVDMSEYMERHAVSKLIGAPPGYVGYDEGGGLTEMVRHRPYSVILFDEIEKAHPEVFNILLQVLDNGRLTDSKGRTVNFKNSIIILTSNIGADFINRQQQIGFAATDEGAGYEKAKDKILERLKEHFRPEFLNRLDEIIIFNMLSREVVKRIVGLQIDLIRKRLQNKGVAIEITDAAADFLAEKGYDPNFGARPLKRVIQDKVLSPIAEMIISRKVEEGGELLVDKDAHKEALSISIKKTGKKRGPTRKHQEEVLTH